MTGSFIIASPPGREGTGGAEESRDAQRYHLHNPKAASERPTAGGGCLDGWPLQACRDGFDVSRYFLLFKFATFPTGRRAEAPRKTRASPRGARTPTTSSRAPWR